MDPENQHASREQKVRDLTEWLTAVGHRQYLPLFLREEIDLSIVPFLQERHLEKMGISTIGARISLLEAAKALKPVPAD